MESYPSEAQTWGKELFIVINQTEESSIGRQRSWIWGKKRSLHSDVVWLFLLEREMDEWELLQKESQ